MIRFGQEEVASIHEKSRSLALSLCRSLALSLCAIAAHGLPRTTTTAFATGVVVCDVPATRPISHFIAYLRYFQLFIQTHKREVGEEQSGVETMPFFLDSILYSPRESGSYLSES